MKQVLMLMCAIMVAGSLTAVPVSAQDMAEETTGPSVTISQGVFCTGVEEHEPVGTGEEFTVDVGRLYCWTELKAGEVPASVTHVWYYEDTKMLEAPLEVNYERTRTWSYKTILPDWTGTWHVDVVGADGTVLGSYSCTVGK